MFLSYADSVDKVDTFNFGTVTSHAGVSISLKSQLTEKYNAYAFR